MAADQYWGNTVLAMHFDGVSNSAAFVEETGKVCTPSNIYLKDTRSKFGGTSLFSNGDSIRYVSLPASSDFDFSGPGSFTIEMWLYIETLTASWCRPLMFGTNGASASLAMWVNSVGAFGFGQAAGGAASCSATGLTAGAWHHVAVCVTGSVAKLFLNGNLATADPNIARPGYGAGNLAYIGGDPNASGSYGSTHFHGYIDELRVTQGVARYSANFTPDTVAFECAPYADTLPPYDDQTVLLLHGDSMVDASRSGVVAANGNAQISTTQKRFGTASIVFDGTGDYLSAADSSSYDFGAADFTVEMFAYLNPGIVFANNPVLISKRPGATASQIAWVELYFTPSGNLVFAAAANATTWAGSVTSASALATSTWLHIAAVRSGSKMLLMINGSVVASGVITVPVFKGSSQLCIGSETAGAYSFNGYIQEVRVTKGIARYVNRFFPPTSAFADPAVFKADDSPAYWAETTIKLDFNGTNNSTYIPNERHGATAVNDGAKLITATKKFGTASAYFDGNTDFISAAGAAIGTLDFTAEAWIYPINGGHNGSDYSRLMLMGVDSALGTLAWINTTTNPDQWFVQGHNGSSWINLIEPVGVKITNNAWHHMALVRKDGTFKMFIDGVPIASKTVAFDIQGTTTYFGANNYGSNGFYGHIDSIRITRGVARYLTRFVPPTKAFENLKVIDPYWDSVTFLLAGGKAPGSTSFVDAKNNLVPTTVNGNIVNSASNPKFLGSSMVSDGAGDWLQYNNAELAITTQAYTIEFFVRLAVGGGYGTIISFLSTKNGGRVYPSVGVKASDRVVFQSVQSIQTTPLTVGQWHHIAITKSGTTASIYLNGAFCESRSDHDVDHQQTGEMYLFSSPNYYNPFGQNACLNGGLDNIRITKGVARYTANFAPPTEPYPVHDFTSVIGGIVKDHTGTPAARRVDIHSQNTGALLGSVTSDATTGAWSFPVNEVCYAVAIDNDVTKRKAIIFDRIQPV